MRLVMLRRFHTEDLEMCTAVQRGVHSSAYRPGRLSHLEKPLWHIQRYLARRITSSRATSAAA
ncbi:MAG: SRPBCC family protein [bacterium]